jgi:hypothetical protein
VARAQQPAKMKRIAMVNKVFWKIFGHTGAVAFSRTGDPATGDFRESTVLQKFGDAPDDLSAL